MPGQNRQFRVAELIPLVRRVAARFGLPVDLRAVIVNCVHVDPGQGPQSDQTVVRVRQRHRKHGSVRLEVTTEGEGWDELATFDTAARRRINEADAGRGRRLFCYLNGETYAALSYHIDDATSVPLTVTAIAVADQGELAIICALLLKFYAHVIAENPNTGRQPDACGLVGFDAPSDARLQQLAAEVFGFHPRTKPPKLTLRGAKYMEQERIDWTTLS